MAKMTLLEMVQDILSDMSSDEVNTINGTVEALQIAQIIKSTYDTMIDGRNWPNLFLLFRLNGSSDVTIPTHMTLPETVTGVEWVKYNIKTNPTDKDAFTRITYKTPKEFMDIVEARDSTATNVQVVTDPTSNISLNIINDKAPQYYTSFDQDTLIFDSFDSGIDTTLNSSKTSAYGRKVMSFTISDSFIPDLPPQMYTALLSKAKAICFTRLLQTTDPHAEQDAITQRRRMSQEAWKIDGGVKYSGYGRTSKKG